ncbi:MAG: tRNA (N6-isopentenyl adenosine(37)-C2)-methylthiotransferase MiaB [Victivallaceae bacterium]|nr:tRNA (N6-isopentenyl adenosine(37)-C2)-methylthiotransferase MiaB [Victivallaceae bacterium]
MNERDSEAIGARLIASGHRLTCDETEADALLFNTCSVRDAAERKAKGKISYLKKLKDRNPELVIGAVGCMAQRLGEKLLDEIPHLDFVVGTGQLHRIVGILEQVRRDRKRICSTEESADVLTGMGDHAAAGGAFGQIAITRGCNRFCSYCIVPYVRGREISRSESDVVDEAKRLVDGGVREILLLGQNVAAYGLNGNTRPPEENVSPFGELLEKLNAIDGLLRIRYTSPYVTYFSDRLIAALRDCEKVCRNIHLPVQSGSDRILKAMNRQYTAQDYLRYVDKLRAALPGVTFSTDVIVGFPDETDEDFAMTRDLLNRVGYSQSFIFKYSPRPGARSAQRPDSVPASVKEERNQILLGDLAARVEKMLADQVGSTVEVLAEGVSRRNENRWTGRTDSNFVVHFEPRDGLKEGDLIKIRIRRAGSVSLFGEIE